MVFSDSNGFVHNEKTTSLDDHLQYGVLTSNSKQPFDSINISRTKHVFHVFFADCRKSVKATFFSRNYTKQKKNTYKSCITISKINTCESNDVVCSRCTGRLL